MSNDNSDLLREITNDYLDKIDLLEPNTKEVGVSLMCIQHRIMESLYQNILDYAGNLPAAEARAAAITDIGWFDHVLENFRESLDECRNEADKINVSIQ